MKALTKGDKRTSRQNRSFPQALDLTQLESVHGGTDTAATVTYGPVITVKPKG